MRSMGLLGPVLGMFWCRVDLGASGGGKFGSAEESSASEGVSVGWVGPRSRD